MARSEEILGLCQSARLIVVPGCGHMLTMERPQFVNAALGEWLDGLDGLDRPPTSSSDFAIWNDWERYEPPELDDDPEDGT